MPTMRHFEMPANDVERAIKFYKEVFDWTMQKLSNLEDPSKDFGFLTLKTKMGIKVLEVD